VLAHHLTRTDMMNALRAYSTLDRNIVLSFTVNGVEMGGSTSGRHQTITVQAVDDDGERFSEIMVYNKEHSVICRRTIDTPQVALSYSVDCSGDDYFYCKVTQADEI
jgi:uncharacterized membrane protein